MSKTTTLYARCECGTGKVKLTRTAFANGNQTIRVTRCTDCPKTYGIRAFGKLERIKAPET